MTIALTRTEVLALNPCSTKRIPPYRRRKTLTAAEALASGATIPDLLWVAAKIGRRDLCVRFALACVQRVVHLAPDNRTQAALDAAQAWLDAPSAETARAAASAATYAAYAAAYATDATDAAERAANVAAEREAQKAIFLEIFA